MSVQDLITRQASDAEHALADMFAMGGLLAQTPGLATARLPYLTTATRTRLQAAVARHPQVTRALFDALGDQSSSVARWAYCLALELGPACGQALAGLLPGVVAEMESQPPQEYRVLRRLDSMLCSAIALVERLAPEQIAGLYTALLARRGQVGRSPWWTFRAWQHLTQALQGQVAAGNLVAMDLVLDLVLGGTSADPGSPAHWRALWAAQQLVPHLPGV